MMTVSFRDAAILAHLSRNRNVLELKEWEYHRGHLETKLAKRIFDRLLQHVQKTDKEKL